MIINNKPDNTAVLSNVGEIGEFRIRNSAKAFSILSSGLYANKIRAIIRELSCNAVDSHADAGNHDTPFDVHLPNSFEPYFSIRDYGTGLTHDQVSKIYTTYFESTKTMSNEFIGALGLGSKSPFSYTENFTVTAIKEGRKGVYSAFINGEGVPSIALMMEEESDEPSGVEIQFSVNDRYDFNKFEEEAREVYTYFKLRPVISGRTEFKFHDLEYADIDIIPGVNALANRRRNGYSNESVAIMGNIAYPIEIPNADESLGDLRRLLGCGLEIRFEIGELDFQASREGLSYIPQTINAIKDKLEKVDKVLLNRFTEQANAIKHPWERAKFVYDKAQNTYLWRTAAVTYVQLNNTPLLKAHGSYVNYVNPAFDTKELAKKYNISVSSFAAYRGSSTMSVMNPLRNNVRGKNDTWESVTTWEFKIMSNSHFVINDTNKGATARTKYHYRQTINDKEQSSYQVYVLEKANKSKPMQTAKFFKALKNAPKDQIFNASELTEKPRNTNTGAGATILHLEEKHFYNSEKVWRNAGKLGDFDSKTKHYYIPLSGYSIVSSYGYDGVASNLISALKNCGVPSLDVKVYGVRKGDINSVKARRNWIDIEEFIVKELKKFPEKDIINVLSKKLTNVSGVDLSMFIKYNNAIGTKLDKNSKFVDLASKIAEVKTSTGEYSSLETLFEYYAPERKNTPLKVYDKYVAYLKDVTDEYPLLQHLNYATESEVVDYIKLVDNSIKEKGNK